MPITDHNGKPAHPFSYHPNEKLANAILDAWKDAKYRDNLLTFSEPYTDGQTPTNQDYATTKGALAKHGIHIAKPVVLTPSQHAVGYQKAPGEVVFVLPDPLDANDGELHDAEIAMVITPCGM